MNRKTANFRVLPDSKGSRFQFFCALSGAHVCTTRPIRSDNLEQALQIAWETEGKQYFNHCSKCGNWVIDAMYNVDALECVDCAPYEGVTLYCKFCGEKAKNIQLEKYGFGPNVMKKTKVCPSCGQLSRTRSMICSHCGARLPFATLFDSYRRRHPCCPHCNTILTADAKFCPQCGRLINTADVNKKNIFETGRRT